MADETEPAKGTKGGEARAAKLTKEELSEAASLAAKSRWAKQRGVPKPDFQGAIDLGDTEIPCAVVELPSGEVVRVINSRQFMTALGRPWKGTYERTGRPNFLEANNLQPFITSDLESVLESVEYRSSTGALAKGYRAEIVPMVCEVYLKARDALLLSKNQLPVAKRAETLMRALAHIGIIALVDEATGYQEIRDRKALREVLKLHIDGKLYEWTLTFPIDFFKGICKLRGWPWNNGRMPSVTGKYINDLVYARLTPGLIQKLQEDNPSLPKGGRKVHHHRLLTRDIGHPALRELVIKEVGMMDALEEGEWDKFKRKLDMKHPRMNDTLPLPLPETD